MPFNKGGIEIILKPQNYILKNFKFRFGESLRELNIEYATFGVKKTDDIGNIINGILYLHGWAGNYSSIERLADVIGPGKVIDTNKYFIICPTALGSPESSSPSTSRLGPEFPKYTIEDMVHAQYILVSEGLGIRHLKGVIGASMGGFQTLMWAVNYPDSMDFIIPIATSFEERGRMFGIYSLMNKMIEGDSDYNHGNYIKQPKRGMENAFIMAFLWTFSPQYYKKEFTEDEELIEALEDIKLESSKKDANDIIWRNKAGLSYNIKDSLSKIKARTLIIGVRDDPLFPPETDTLPLAKAINRAKVFIYDSILGHLGINEIKKAENVINDFLK